MARSGRSVVEYDGGSPEPRSISIPATTPNRLEAVHAAVLAGALQQLIDDLPEQIALLDKNCNILAANQAWKKIVEQHGYEGASQGDNYRDFCKTAAAEGYQPAVEAHVALKEISAGSRKFWQLTYNGRDRWDGRDFQICFHRIDVENQQLILVSRFDLTEIIELRRLKDNFSSAFIEGQAKERQRIGRELHDSISQSLTAMGLVLGRLEQQLPCGEDLDVIDELRGLVGEAQQEIRAISYLAYPPSLERLGLEEALKALVAGYARRTSVEASFEIQGETSPISTTAEVAIYRLAQEALSNVQRHALAGRVSLMLRFRKAAIHFVVADDGIGISQDTLAGKEGGGVGLTSMQSRFTEMGGRMSIRQLSPGTAIVASLPRRQKSVHSKPD